MSENANVELLRGDPKKSNKQISLPYYRKFASDNAK